MNIVPNPPPGNNEIKQVVMLRREIKRGRGKGRRDEKRGEEKKKGFREPISFILSLPFSYHIPWFCPSKGFLASHLHPLPPS